MFKSILVLESPWDNSSVESTSVWPFVSEFAKARGIRAYHQAFLDKSSFIHWVESYNKEKLAEPKLLYIAAHGNGGRVSGLKKTINKKNNNFSYPKIKKYRFCPFRFLSIWQ